MSYENAKEYVRVLSHSQGFYGRLLRDLNEDSDYGQQVREWLERVASKCNDQLDLILAIECE